MLKASIITLQFSHFSHKFSLPQQPHALDICHQSDMSKKSGEALKSLRTVLSFKDALMAQCKQLILINIWCLHFFKKYL